MTGAIPLPSCSYPAAAAARRGVPTTAATAASTSAARAIAAGRRRRCIVLASFSAASRRGSFSSLPLRPQSARNVLAAAEKNGDADGSSNDEDASSSASLPPFLAALAASPTWRLRAELRWRRLPVSDSDAVSTSELARRLVEGLETRATEEGVGGGGSAGGEDPRFFVDPSSPPSEAVCDTMVPSELRSALKAYGVRYPKAKADALAMLRAAMSSKGWPPPTAAEAAAEAAAKAAAKGARSSSPGKHPKTTLGVAQIRARLTELGVIFPKTAKKAALAPMLEEALARLQAESNDAGSKSEGESGGEEEEEESAAEVGEAASPSPSPSRSPSSPLANWTMAELRAGLRSRGAKITGNKSALVARLAAAMEAAEREGSDAEAAEGAGAAVGTMPLSSSSSDEDGGDLFDLDLAGDGEGDGVDAFLRAQAEEAAAATASAASPRRPPSRAAAARVAAAAAAAAAASAAASAAAAARGGGIVGGSNFAASEALGALETWAEEVAELSPVALQVELVLRGLLPTPEDVANLEFLGKKVPEPMSEEALRAAVAATLHAETAARSLGLAPPTLNGTLPLLLRQQALAATDPGPWPQAPLPRVRVAALVAWPTTSRNVSSSPAAVSAAAGRHAERALDAAATVLEALPAATDQHPDPAAAAASEAAAVAAAAAAAAAATAAAFTSGDEGQEASEEASAAAAAETAAAAAASAAAAALVDRGITVDTWLLSSSPLSSSAANGKATRAEPQDLLCSTRPADVGVAVARRRGERGGGEGEGSSSSSSSSSSSVIDLVKTLAATPGAVAFPLLQGAVSDGDAVPSSQDLGGAPLLRTLEEAGVPFVGPSSEAAAAAADLRSATAILSAAGLRTLPLAEIVRGEDDAESAKRKIDEMCRALVDEGFEDEEGKEDEDEEREQGDFPVVVSLATKSVVVLKKAEENEPIISAFPHLARGAAAAAAAALRALGSSPSAPAAVVRPFITGDAVRWKALVIGTANPDSPIALTPVEVDSLTPAELAVEQACAEEVERLARAAGWSEEEASDAAAAERATRAVERGLVLFPSDGTLGEEANDDANTSPLSPPPPASPPLLRPPRHHLPPRSLPIETVRAVRSAAAAAHRALGARDVCVVSGWAVRTKPKPAPAPVPEDDLALGADAFVAKYPDGPNDPMPMPEQGPGMEARLRLEATAVVAEQASRAAPAPARAVTTDGVWSGDDSDDSATHAIIIDRVDLAPDLGERSLAFLAAADAGITHAGLLRHLLSLARLRSKKGQGKEESEREGEGEEEGEEEEVVLPPPRLVDFGRTALARAHNSPPEETPLDEMLGEEEEWQDIEDTWRDYRMELTAPHPAVRRPEGLEQGEGEASGSGGGGGGGDESGKATAKNSRSDAEVWDAYEAAAARWRAAGGASGPSESWIDAEEARVLAEARETAARATRAARGGPVAVLSDPSASEAERESALWDRTLRALGPGGLRDEELPEEVDPAGPDRPLLPRPFAVSEEPLEAAQPEAALAAAASADFVAAVAELPVPLSSVPMSLGLRLGKREGQEEENEGGGGGGGGGGEGGEGEGFLDHLVSPFAAASSAADAASPVLLTPPLLPQPPTRIWILTGGDGPGRDEAFASGVHAATLLAGAPDTLPEVFLLEARTGAGGRADERPLAVLRRRAMLLAAGCPVEELEEGLRDVHSATWPLPTEEVVEARAIWALAPSAALRPSADDAAAAAARDASAASVLARDRRSERHFDDVAQAARASTLAQLDAAGVAAAGGAWGVTAAARAAACGDRAVLLSESGQCLAGPKPLAQGSAALSDVVAAVAISESGIDLLEKAEEERVDRRYFSDRSRDPWLQPSSRRLDVEAFAEEAAAAGAVVLLCLPATDDDVHGPLQIVLKKAGAVVAGPSPAAAELASSAGRVAEALGELEAHNVSAPPRTWADTAALAALAENESGEKETLAGASRMFDEIRAAVGAPAASSVLCRPGKSGSATERPVRVRDAAALLELGKALRRGAPATPDGDGGFVALPAQGPRSNCFEPDVPDDGAVLSLNDNDEDEESESSSVNASWSGKGRWLRAEVALVGERKGMRALAPTVAVADGRLGDSSCSSPSPRALSLTPPPPSLASQEALDGARARCELAADQLGLSGSATVRCYIHARSADVIITEVLPVSAPLVRGGALLAQALAEDPPVAGADVVRELARLAAEQAAADAAAAEEDAAAGIEEGGDGGESGSGGTGSSGVGLSALSP